MFTDTKGITRTLENHPSAPAYHWVVVETELRAWVENPCFGLPNEPVYILAEITNASWINQRAEIRPVDEACAYWVDYALIHCVHTYAPSRDMVTKVHGEIRQLQS